MLQALNILENFDLKAMGYNSARYIHTRLPGDEPGVRRPRLLLRRPAFPAGGAARGPAVEGVREERARRSTGTATIPPIKPGDPYPFQGGTNPYCRELPRAGDRRTRGAPGPQRRSRSRASSSLRVLRGTTSIEAADAEGLGGVGDAERRLDAGGDRGPTGIGLSQRAQSFVLDPAENPFNVIEPGKRPRVTLTPTLALKDGKPFLAFAVQGGDSQDQNLLQFFLNVVEFGMTPQEAAEAPNINSYQMRNSFGEHESSRAASCSTRRRRPGCAASCAHGLQARSPNAICFDRKHGTMWGGSSNHGEDYGIAWCQVRQ